MGDAGRVEVESNLAILLDSTIGEILMLLTLITKESESGRENKVHYIITYVFLSMQTTIAIQKSEFVILPGYLLKSMRCCCRYVEWNCQTEPGAL